jgi:hypothetical protein
MKFNSVMNGNQSGKLIYNKLSKPLVIEVLLSREDEPTQIIGSQVLDWRCLINRDTKVFTLDIKSSDMQNDQYIGKLKVKLDLVPKAVNPVTFIDSQRTSKPVLSLETQYKKELKAYWVKYISKGPKFEKRFRELVESTNTPKQESFDFENGDDEFWIRKAYSHVET